MSQARCIHEPVCRYLKLNHQALEICNNVEICKYYLESLSHNTSTNISTSASILASPSSSMSAPPKKSKRPKKRGAYKKKGYKISNSGNFAIPAPGRGRGALRTEFKLTTSKKDIIRARQILKERKRNKLLTENQIKALEGIGSKRYKSINDIQKQQILDILNESSQATINGDVLRI